MPSQRPAPAAPAAVSAADVMLGDGVRRLHVFAVRGWCVRQLHRTREHQLAGRAVIGFRALRALAISGLIGVTACGNPGRAPLDETVSRIDALIDSLAEAGGDPATARQALATWEADNGPALDALRRQADGLRRQLSAAQQRDLAARWDTASRRLQARLESHRVRGPSQKIDKPGAH